MSNWKKRPRDANQLAKFIVDVASGEIKDRPPTPEELGKNPHVVAAGRKGGLKGGLARAKTMTPAQRSKAAKRAARKRWNVR